MTLHNTFTASVKFLYIIIMVIHVVTQELNCTCIKGNL